MENKNIQIINYDGKSDFSSDDIFISDFTQPKSLDEFYINVIDLSSENFWRYNGYNLPNINNEKDFINLREMLTNKLSSNVIIIFPQNNLFRYKLNSFGYSESTALSQIYKDIFGLIKKILIPEKIADKFNFSYENTTTKIDEFEYESAFHFIMYFYSSEKTKSISNKITTVMPLEKFFITTLNILKSKEHLLSFLRECKLISKKEDYPKWLTDYHILNDEKLQSSIIENETVIKNAKDNIFAAQNELDKNMKFKSVLFNNGDSLASQVFVILEKIFGIDLSEFIDLKKEDFLFPIDADNEFIGEIKGVTSNVKNEHISQLEIHYQKRFDELQEKNAIKNTKALLIINPLRTTPINDREPINKNQIDLAKRNGSLIVETKMLLKIYELFMQNEITTDNLIEIFQNEIGLLTEDILKKYIKQNFSSV